MHVHRPFLRVAKMRRALLTFAALAGAACAGGEGPAGPPSPKPVASIVVAPGADTLIALGRQRVYTAVARDADGTILTGVAIKWRSSDTLIARVDSTTGVVTAVNNGQAFIRAVSGTVEGTGTVNVIQFVASVTVTPGTAGLAAIGATQAYTAVARDSANAVVTGVRFLWISSNPTVATIDTNGVATAVAAGNATISASGRGVPAYSTLTVTQNATQLAFSVEPALVRAGDAFSTALQVEVRDAGGALVRDSRIPVTISAPLGTGPLHGALTVNAVNGIATFSNVWLEQAGPAQLIAGSAGLSPDTSSSFTVRPGVPADFSVLLDPEPDFEAGLGTSAYIVLYYSDRLGNAADSAPALVFPEVRGPLGQAVAYRIGAPDRAVAGRIGFPTFAVSRPGAGFTLQVTTVFASGDVTHATLPFSVRANFSSVALSSTHACGAAPGGILCWGSNAAGQLGRASFPVIPQDSIAERIVHPGSFTQVDVGDQVSCALRTDGAAFCWGSGPNGVVPGTGAGGLVFTQISVGETFRCGLTAAGAAYCWGGGNAGQLGDGNATDSNSPVHVSGSGTGSMIFTQISAGRDFACGRTTLSTAWCWGYNGSGQLGDSTQANAATPVLVRNSGAGSLLFTSIDASPGETACAVTNTGSLYCWGRGPLADGSFAVQTVPRRVILGAAGVAVEKVSLGYEHGCLVRVGGELRCWGYGSEGQIGPAGTAFVQAHFPVDVGGRTVLDVSTGRYQTCARTTGGVYCFGNNASGVLGIGSTAQLRVSQPTRIVQ